jgi:hypothetical protein
MNLRVEGMVSVLDGISMGSSLSLRSTGVVGSSVSVSGLARARQSVSILGAVSKGSLLSVRAAIRAEVRNRSCFEHVQFGTEHSGSWKQHLCENPCFCEEGSTVSERMSARQPDCF